MEKEIEDFINEHKQQDEYYEGDRFHWYMSDDNIMALIAVVKNLNKPAVSGRSEQLRTFSKWYEEKYKFQISEDAIKEFESLGS